MTSVAEIYCYLNPDFTGDLDRVVDSLKAEGHRLVLGEDLEELMLLLQLAQPTGIIYTLSNEEALVSPPFQALSKEALKKSMPIIVIGPDASLDKFTLYKPKGTRFDEIEISMERLVDIVDALLHKLDALILPEIPQLEKSKTEDGRARLFDVLGAGKEATEIETVAKITDKTRLITTVSKAGEILVLEEQTVENDDPQLKKKMKTQHHAAAKAYVPAPSQQVEVKQNKYRGEISAPFESPPRSEKKEERKSLSPKRVRTVQMLMAVGALLCLGAVLYLSTRTNAPSIEKDLTLPFNDPLPSGDQPRLEPDNDTSTQAVVPDSKRIISDDLDEGTTLPFPASFRPGKTLFLFLDEWEEHRFVNMIRGVSEQKIIHVIGHATRQEVKAGKGFLGRSRAWTVYRYLARNGIPADRLKASSGKPLVDTGEKDQKGRPRRRFVEIILEKAQPDKESTAHKISHFKKNYL